MKEVEQVTQNTDERGAGSEEEAVGNGDLILAMVSALWELHYVPLCRTAILCMTHVPTLVVLGSGCTLVNRL